ncbi:NUDIX domain-containing protein [Patescibacteria group bacterium]|nr:NUDIX domain-containing protein [Patescibacteria group bacterium]
MKEKNKKVRVGVGVIINKKKKILLMKRRGSHGAETWAPPGGHIDFGESVTNCAKREVKEEIGIEIKNLEVVGFTEDLFKKEKKHYITIWVISDWKSSKSKICNEEMSKINWFDWNSLPKPLFLPLKNLLKGKVYPE